MARTAVTVTKLAENNSVADPSGTNLDPTNDHEVSGVPLEELVLEINSTFAGAKTFTIVAGDKPPALEAGQGPLVVSLNAAVGLVGPFTSGRFMNSGVNAGKLHIDVEAGATGTIKALHVPREA
ncbi:MAG: hypothetical protein ACRDNE_00600 [Gaiellaceae bacterium]